MFKQIEKESILIPAEALRWEDWNEQDLVFLSLMAYIHNTQPAEDLNTEYNFYAKDFFSILHTQNSSTDSGIQLENLRRMYRIGVVDKYNVLVQPKDGIYDNYTESKLNVPVVKHIIQTKQALRTYSYLCGRLAGNGNIVSEYIYRKEEEGTIQPHMQWTFRHTRK